MPVKNRTLTLLVSDFLFIAISLGLFLRPAGAVALYPLYGLLFLWSDARRESETPLIFIFLATFAGLLLIARAPQTQAVPLIVEIAALWTLNFSLSWHRDSAFAAQRAMTVERQQLDARLLDQGREIDYYRQYEKNASLQIRLRRELAEGAKNIGSALNAEEVKARLVSILSARFPGCRIGLMETAEGDPILKLAAAKKGPVLIKDAAQEMRFSAIEPGLRAALAVPMNVMHRPAGYLKLESAQPGAFGPDDAKTADLLATVAAMSLENIRFYEQIQAQAVRDHLTRLYSHKAFEERLQEELLRAGRGQTPLSLIMCDVDHFKVYNDRYGHQAGDALLRTVAGILAAFARPVDFPARYGGEEFALILPAYDRAAAAGVAEKIRERVAAESFVFQGRQTSASLSLGVASFPQDATTSSQLVRAADERLYRAKSSGRNRVVG